MLLYIVANFLVFFHCCPGPGPPQSSRRGRSPDPSPLSSANQTSPRKRPPPSPKKDLPAQVPKRGRRPSAGGDPSQGDKPQNKAAERIDMVLATNKKIRDALVECGPDAIWRSAIRAAELDRRLGKISAADRDLQKLLVNGNASEEQKNAATSLQDEISQLGSQVSTLKLLCNTLRSQEPKSLAAEIHHGSELEKTFSGASKQLFKNFNVLLDMIHFIAKKLAQASL